MPLQIYTHCIHTHASTHTHTRACTCAAHKWAYQNAHTVPTDAEPSKGSPLQLSATMGRSLRPNTKEKEHGTLAFNSLLLVCGYDVTSHLITMTPHFLHPGGLYFQNCKPK